MIYFVINNFNNISITYTTSVGFLATHNYLNEACRVALLSVPHSIFVQLPIQYSCHV